MMTTLAAADPALVLRLVLFVLFGGLGTFAMFHASREHGYGLIWLVFGCYLLLLWIALRPDRL